MDFLLRPWRATDAPSVAKFANNPNVSANLRDVFLNPYTLADARRFVEDCIAKEGPRQCCRAIVMDGEAVGSIGVFLQEDAYRLCGELNYWLGEPYWGWGVMHRAVKRLCDFVFANYDICRIYAEPFAENIGSRRVLEQAGFTLEGVMRQGIVKHGAVRDYCIYALLREDWEKENDT